MWNTIGVMIDYCHMTNEQHDLYLRFLLKLPNDLCIKEKGNIRLLQSLNGKYENWTFQGFESVDRHRIEKDIRMGFD